MMLRCLRLVMEKNGPYCPWEKNLKISTTRFQPLPSLLQIKYDSQNQLDLSC